MAETFSGYAGYLNLITFCVANPAAEKNVGSEPVFFLKYLIKPE
jgi:hypothetical protein